MDRFGLAVEVQAERDAAVRAEVVRRRIAFDQNPAAFVARWVETEQAERQRLVAGRRLLSQVRLDDALLYLITGICTDFGVDGMRADIAMYRAAVALAAYEGRTDVCENDVRQVARLVLPHRRRRQPFDQPTVDDQALEESLDAIARHPRAGHRLRRQLRSRPTSSPQQVRRTPQNLVPRDLPRRTNRRVSASRSPSGRSKARCGRILLPPGAGRRSRTLGGTTGHYVTSRQPPGRVRDIAVDATLRAAAPHLRRRQQEEGKTPAIHYTDLRQKVRESRPATSSSLWSMPAVLWERGSAWWQPRGYSVLAPRCLSEADGWAW